MTEEEWLTTSDAGSLIQSLRGKADPRRFKLLACARCRSLLESRPTPTLMDMLTAAERWCDGEMSKGDLQALAPDPTRFSRTKSTAHDLSHHALFHLTEWNQSGRMHYDSEKGELVHYSFAEGEQLESELNIVLRTAGEAIVRHRLDVEHPTIQDDQALARIRSEEADHLRSIIRDIFGNTFRRRPSDPAWQSTTAFGIAQSMYHYSDFAAMPILADALQDAGCEVAAILEHCRDPQQDHVRGCWVVDLVLGKS